MTISLRTATPADVDDLLALWEVAAENDGRPGDSAAAVERLLDRDPAACLVAEAEGRIVGTIVAGWDGWRAHLYRLAVHPGARRQGVARQLLAAAEERLTALGAGRIDAMVLEHNGLGQELWKSADYAPQPEWRRWVKPAR